MPVETLAQSMAIDAYQYKGSSSGATATDNVVIMTNSDIYRTVQVIYCIIMMIHCFNNVIPSCRLVNEGRLKLKDYN